LHGVEVIGLLRRDVGKAKAALVKCALPRHDGDPKPVAMALPAYGFEFRCQRVQGSATAGSLGDGR
jgi:hypothetical protein